MGEARLRGSATKASEKVKAGGGKLTGDQKLKRKGVFDEIKAKVQTALGSIKDAIRGK
jgi:uncharacterized protein YjbJ (UPF0337 family)